MSKPLSSGKRRLAFALAPLLLVACAAAPAATPAHVAESAAVQTTYTVDREKQVVQLMLNGQGPYAFHFDTGAGSILLSPDLKDELGLPVVGTEIANSPGSDSGFEVETVNITALGLGDAVALNVEALVVDMFRGDIVGVLGPSIFKSYDRFAIDFSTCEMHLGGAFLPRADAEWIAFGDTAPLLDVTLEIAGQSIPAHIDSGAPQVLALPMKYAILLPLTGPLKEVARGRMVDREIVISEAPSDLSVSVGQSELDLPAIQFFDVPFANLGLKGLQGQYLEIDWARQRFALQPSPSPAGACAGQ